MITLRRLPGVAAAVALTALLAACAAEPLTQANVTPTWKEQNRKPADPEARLAVVAAFRAACLDTSLDLGGADSALSRLGYRFVSQQGDDRRFEKGRTSVTLRLGKQRPVVASRCVVADPRMDRFASIAAVKDATQGSGPRYEPRDLAALGDPDAHDVRGSLLGANYIGVLSVVDESGEGGLAVLKSRKSVN